MSTISREAVMKEIEDMIKSNTTYVYTRDELRELKSRIESIPQEPTDWWISVEDRLPEEWEYIIFDYVIWIAQYEDRVWTDEIWRKLEVIYWKPLPKSPKQ